MVTKRLNTARRDGVNLRYLDVGRGDPPLLFIHGWCCNHTHWRDQIPEFSKRHRVVAVDLRGLGDSDRPEQDYTVPGFADDVPWLISDVGLEKPVVIGHSMGGQIALNVIRKHPDLASAAVFVDAVMMPSSDQFKPMLASLIDGMKSPAYQDVTANFVKIFLFNENSPVAMRDETAATMANAPQRLMHTAMASLTSEENMPGGAIPVPSLFIRAATNTNSAQEISERYGGLAVEEVDCAHFVQLERPAETNAIISRFLEKLH